MARQSPNRNEADEPAADASATSSDDTELTGGSDTGLTGAADTELIGGAGADDSSAADGSLWDKVRISPVEIALPAGTGFTLRAYRRSSTLTPTSIDDRLDDDPFDVRARQAESDEDDEEEVVILDEEFAALLEEDEKDARGAKAADGTTDADDEPAAEDLDDDEPDEEVPVFLSNRGRLLMFKSPETLVAFVRSGASHDMAQLDTWNELAERVQPADIVPREDDQYELDLVVENLRGGHDTWDLDLLIDAGEVARDLAYALRLRPVLTGLSAGSPLDDLDEALRSAAGGGVGGFMGRRRLRKIGAQQASLGWRAIIGKISAAVDWRD